MRIETEKHPRQSIRLKRYDYSSPGYYYVTICTKHNIEYLGERKNGKMILNQFGNIVNQQWKWLSNQYKYVEIDEFAVMPNHFHGILIIDPTNVVNRRVVTGRDLSLQKIKPLPELIGAFKTTSSKLIHQSGLDEFRWQRSFYDHIIRTETSLNKIQRYIMDNPLK